MVFEHGDAFGAEAGREAGELCGVVAAVLQHDRVNHAAAADLQPAAALANRAALAAADEALHVDLRARLGEREV